MHCRNLPLLAGLALVLMGSLLAVNGGFCLTSQDVPAADLPTPNASPATATSPSPGAASSEEDVRPANENYEPPEPASTATQADTSEGYSLPNDQGPTDTQADQGADTSGSMPAGASPPPALDAASVTVGPQLGDESLEPEIRKAIAPTLAASLRLTDSARKLLAQGQVDDAMRGLARAISLDPADAFAYYYLGRAYFAKRNYAQAATFFRRAEIGFDGRADWTAEALSYQGLCDEELGKDTSAAQAYKQALAAAPDNFRARIGYGRLATIAVPGDNGEAASSGQNLALPPPVETDESAPPEQPPPLPPE
jgi:TolA-binding protein